MRLQQLYDELLITYGPQGWWPRGTIKGKEYTCTYHPGNYEGPAHDRERFEICIGAILTQNTAWTNVTLALERLTRAKAIDPQAILTIDHDELKELIRPAGYYNQKADYLKAFATFYQARKGRTPTRNELLAVKGIGKETADSILLYAYSQPYFIIDAYTKRILEKHGLIQEGMNYDDVQALFHDELEKNVAVFQEFHALLVAHAKNHYQKKPYGKEDPLRMRSS